MIKINTDAETSKLQRLIFSFIKNSIFSFFIKSGISYIFVKKHRSKFQDIYNPYSLRSVNDCNYPKHTTYFFQRHHL